jgi:hypothetical protein
VTIQTALREVNNAVLDLQSADYNTFERPLERLALALNADRLKLITDGLRSKAHFDEFLESANEGGSMMGSARLNWPSGREEELGLTIQLIERAAKNPRWFLNLAHKYYYSGRKIIGDIRKITSAVIIPFNRDFVSYVEELVPSLLVEKGGNSIVTEEDKEDLLCALFESGQASDKRPSVQNVAIKYFPEWSRDRLIESTKALEQEGAILNLTGAMIYVDLSSNGRKRAEQRSAKAASGVTYNIGAMHNSPLQHISPGGHGVQTTSYSSDDLQNIVTLYKRHIDELGLDTAQRRRADAQIATIEAQLIDEPDPTIVKAAGKSLKTIIEGAIGGAAGTALASAQMWAPLLSMFG